MTSPREKCGIIGVYTRSHHATILARNGLAALQHRGQESAGISFLSSEHTLSVYKKMGLVPHVLTDAVLQKLGNSSFAIGHNRYATSGQSRLANAQPLFAKQGSHQLTLAHNGNIPDLLPLQKALKSKTKTLSDTQLLIKLLIKKRALFASWEDVFQHILPLCHGAYNLVALTNEKSLFGIRDPFGIRPLCLGKLHNGWVISSESVALDTIGADFVRDVLPGELIRITKEGIQSSFFGEAKRAKPCLFEYIYFARPDSFLNGKRVRTGRETSGEFLGKRIAQKKIHADAVVPIFESGYPAAKGVARALCLPIIDAITTSNYVGRTFIQSGQEKRAKAATGKHNIVPDEIIGKRVIVVDDSAVRLTTSRALILSLKESGASQVFFAIASPPVVDQCDLGIDMRKKHYLPASQFADQPLERIEMEMAKLISADAMIYLPIDETTKAFGRKKEDCYYAPFGGPHPIRGKQDAFPLLQKKITGKVRIVVFISGNGTYLQDLIDGINNHTIDAEIVLVIANKPDIGGISRAEKYHIPVQVISYKGKLSDNHARDKYEKQLVKVLSNLAPDLILLSGWQMILGDVFLTAMQKKQIVVINHHPSLLTNTNEQTVATSRGVIPVFRGAHVAKEAFLKKLPVTGVTVHQVLPNKTVDVGNVIMKAEVRIHPSDSWEEVEKHMQEMEHHLVPTAIKRVIHMLKQGIDCSRGI